MSSTTAIMNINANNNTVNDDDDDFSPLPLSTVGTNVKSMNKQQANTVLRLLPKQNLMPSLSLFSVPTISSLDIITPIDDDDNVNDNNNSCSSTMCYDETMSSSLSSLTTNIDTVLKILEFENDDDDNDYDSVTKVIPVDKDTFQRVDDKHYSLNKFNRRSSPTSIMDTFALDQQSHDELINGCILPLALFGDDDDDEVDGSFRSV